MSHRLILIFCAAAGWCAGFLMGTSGTGERTEKSAEVSAPISRSRILLLDSIEAFALKDSLAVSGWTERKDFPYFYKSVRTGGAPKSCSFSPDGKIIAVTLLAQPGKAVQLYDAASLTLIRTVVAPCSDAKNNLGYAEGVFREEDSTFWFTRMTTGDFFVYHMKSDSVESYNAHGVWTKIIEFNPAGTLVALAHWVSDDVSVFEVKPRRHLTTIKVGRTPRGIAWLDSTSFAVALFGDGMVKIFDAVSGKALDTIISVHGAAMRDVKFDDDSSLLYFSDMAGNFIYQYSCRERKIIHCLTVDDKPNSIRLSKDARYLFVSCRGPNNPEGYTKRSPRGGKLFMIRTDDFSIVKSWSGGNQPTGLDVSPDGKYVATTDFNENKLNLLQIAY